MLQCHYNQLTSLDMSMFTNLSYLECDNNLFSALDLSSLQNLTFLICDNNQLTSLIFPMQIESASCSHNQLQQIDIANLESLTTFDCSNNFLTGLHINPTLSMLNCSSNQISTLDLSQMTWHALDFSYNQISEITLPPQHEPSDLYLNISGNLYTQIDYPIDVQYASFTCKDTQLGEIKLPFVLSGAGEDNTVMNNANLQHIDAKNGYTWQLCMYNPQNTLECNLTIANNPNLLLFCVDDAEMENTQVISSIIANNNPNLIFSSYCNFLPGGNYNSVTGNIKFDFSGNGCDTTDFATANIPVKIHPVGYPDYVGQTFTNPQGVYTNYSTILYGVDDVVITPQFENPYFTVNPNSYETAFAGFGNTQQADFCITPNGTHPDLEVSISPMSPALPGFDCLYKISYKNKGTETQSGNVTLTFQDDILDLISANPATDAQITNQLTWNFTNLAPFETREISVTLNLNSPMEIPAVNMDDLLAFSAMVDSQTDETPFDNVGILNQYVVNSMDPNDKAVAEGDFILPTDIGNYLHYTIRFQNTGNFAAQNVVIKDVLATNFDLTSLQITGASHPYRATLTQTNKLEFFFENIQLPPISENEPGSHGYVTFKVKPKNTVVQGDDLENKAEIYFDFNWPIITNTVATHVAEPLAMQKFEKNDFVLYPNPTSSLLNIQSDVKINSVVISNHLGQTILKTTHSDAIDVSGLAGGVYFVKVTSAKGNATQKFIKI